MAGGAHRFPEAETVVAVTSPGWQVRQGWIRLKKKLNNSNKKDWSHVAVRGPPAGVRVGEVGVPPPGVAVGRAPRHGHPHWLGSLKLVIWPCTLYIVQYTSYRSTQYRLYRLREHNTRAYSL